MSAEKSIRPATHRPRRSPRSLGAGRAPAEISGDPGAGSATATSPGGGPAADDAPRRRDLQRAETRNRLFDAAMAEFRRVGFANAQIEDVVARANVARGTFYFHFPTKEHVLIEHQHRVQEAIVERLGGLRLRSPSVKRFLEQVMDVMLAEASAAAQMGLLREVLGIVVVHGVDVDWASQPMLDAVSQFLAEAAERGEVRADLTPLELTSVFLTIFLGVLLSNTESPGPELRPALRRALDVFVRGISP